MSNQAEKRDTLRKEKIGIVLSNKMTKTIVVQIRHKTRDRNYGKVVERATKFKVHDEKNEAKVGDRVRIVETRPLSREKRWRLVEILGHSQTIPSIELKDDANKPATTGASS